MLSGGQKYRYDDDDDDNDNKLLQDLILKAMSIDNHNSYPSYGSAKLVVMVHSSNTIEG